MRSDSVGGGGVLLPRQSCWLASTAGPQLDTHVPASPTSRNYTDYFSFEAGSSSRALSPETQQRIQLWLQDQEGDTATAESP